MEKQESSGNTEERFLVFKLGDSRFAMMLLAAKEVMAPRKTTPIPSSNKIINGILNLRGDVITIIDLKAKLGITTKPNNDSEASFIILDDNQYSYGIMVDAVETVLSIKNDQIEDISETMDKSKATHAKRLAKVDGKLILILDIEDLVADLSHRELKEKNNRTNLTAL